MEIFYMTDVIPLLNIPQPPMGKSSYYIPCPCCDDGRRKKGRNGHLNINLIKNVFRCPRCNFSGGVLDLYSYFANVPRENAWKILSGLLGDRGIKTEKNNIKLQTPTVFEEYAPTDIKIRNDTYMALLNKLTLASDHYENLLNRGLSEQAIKINGYKTTPLIGNKLLASKLLEDGCYLSGVPGFFKKNGEWSFKNTQRGILIPVRDIDGQIQGLQIRRDNIEKRKFRWVSSSGEHDGCRAEGWVHLAGSPEKQIVLTEGPMKADVIHHLSGKTVLAVPGVNTLNHLESALQRLKKMGLEKIMTAFDMDFLKNPHVQIGYENLVLLMEQLGIKFGTYIWDNSYKGLDDYIWECLMQKNHPQ